MYQAEFEIENFRFHGPITDYIDQWFKVVGIARVRTRENRKKREGEYPASEMRYYTARSKRPFVVVVLTRAGGFRRHRDCGINIVRSEWVPDRNK